MDKWLNGQMADVQKLFSRIQLPHISWRKITGYTLSLSLLIPATLGLHRQLFPLDEQLTQLKTAVLSNSFSAQPHIQLGTHLFTHGNEKQAQHEFQLASKLAPKQTQARYDQLQTQKASINLQTKFWKEQLQQKPDYRDAYLKLASLYYQQGQTEKAKKLLKKAEQIDPNYPPLLKLQQKLN